jgi:hypothetical protein
VPLDDWNPVELTMIDTFFWLAAGALGWGLSLATYRLFAHRNSWPMGQLHADVPLIPVMIGVGAIAVGLVFSAARGSEFGGWYILGVGVILAIAWTAFLRVGSQVSLFLAPGAAAMLVMGFLGFPLPGNYDIVPAGMKTRTTSSFTLDRDRIEDRTLQQRR